MNTFVIYDFRTFFVESPDMDGVYRTDGSAAGLLAPLGAYLLYRATYWDAAGAGGSSFDQAY